MHRPSPALPWREMVVLADPVLCALYHRSVEEEVEAEETAALPYIPKVGIRRV